VSLSDELALSRHAHDRLGNQRVDAGWVEQRWADPNTRVLLLHRNTVAVDDSGQAPAYLSPHEAAEAGEAAAGRGGDAAGDAAGDDAAGDGGEAVRVLLGWEDGVTYFGLLLPEAPQGRRLAGLREVGPVLADRDAGLVTHAVALANWHRVYRHCPRCSGRLRPEQAGHVRRCEACGRQQFPRTDPAVIMLVTDGGGAGERCLLAHNAASHRERGYSTLAGFVEPGESLEHAVRREILEEVGVQVGAVTYAGSQPWPLPGSVMVGFYAAARTTDISVDGEEIADARWFSRRDLLAAAESGDIVLPGHISIARRLIESWYGGSLPGSW
jgi:NAD+ diphosphatase